MSDTGNHKEIKKARQLIVSAAAVYGCSLGDINGIKDTIEKVMTIYLVKTTLSLNDDQLASLFQINKAYMITRLENLTIQMLIDAKAKELLMAPLKYYKSLELIDIIYG